MVPGISFAVSNSEAADHRAERGAMRIHSWKTLNDDLKNGALVSVIAIVLVCIAIILYGR